jgi:hypothetical protein
VIPIVTRTFWPPVVRPSPRVSLIARVRLDDGDPRSIEFRLLSEHHRKRREDALIHFGFGKDQLGSIVGTNAHPTVEWSSGPMRRVSRVKAAIQPEPMTSAPVPATIRR